MIATKTFSRQRTTLDPARLPWPFLLLLLAILAPRAVRAGGDEVVVLYNSRAPESRSVAEHYAAARHVPAAQIFGFALTTNEVMARADFTDLLQKPLAERLEAAGLWKFGEVKIPGTNGQAAVTQNRVVKSKIRYAVLCPGMPLKIEAGSLLEEFAEKITNANLRRNDAAVDSELAWLPLCREKIPLPGPLPNPFYGLTNRTLLNCTNGLLLVSRLDAPTPEIAKGLVDKALAAEHTGLWGRAYFDARGLQTNDAYYLGDQWLCAGAEICRQLGFETLLDTNADVLPASFPMSHIAIYAGWYAGDVCGPFALPAVEFMPGAFAYHLHSYSAATLRSATHNWCGPLLAKGATCTMGCVNEPYLQFTPNIAHFLGALGSGWTFGEAAWAAQPSLSWQTTVVGDPLYQPFRLQPVQLHAQLAREKNRLIEWSFNRLASLDLIHGMREPALIHFLESVPATAGSAVLTERLADLYDAAGKPSSTIAARQEALRLKPSPQQRLRLRLALGENLRAQKRVAEAEENYRALLAEAPDYPGRPQIEELIKALAPEPPDTNAPAKH